MSRKFTLSVVAAIVLTLLVSGAAFAAEGNPESELKGARRAYGIGGATTVQKWIRKYGHEDLLQKRVRIETLKERDELKEARKRIRELEAAVADAHIECCLEKAYVHVACERMGVDPDEFKKKNAMTLSKLRKSSLKGLK